MKRTMSITWPHLCKCVSVEPSGEQCTDILQVDVANPGADEDEHMPKRSSGSERTFCSSTLSRIRAVSLQLPRRQRRRGKRRSHEIFLPFCTNVKSSVHIGPQGLLDPTTCPRTSSTRLHHSIQRSGLADLRLCSQAKHQLRGPRLSAREGTLTLPGAEQLSLRDTERAPCCDSARHD
jgi:hypothetical protein